jgi:hypothetical protein
MNYEEWNYTFADGSFLPIRNKIAIFRSSAFFYATDPGKVEDILGRKDGALVSWFASWLEKARNTTYGSYTALKEILAPLPSNMPITNAAPGGSTIQADFSGTKLIPEKKKKKLRQRLIA